MPMTEGHTMSPDYACVGTGVRGDHEGSLTIWQHVHGAPVKMLGRAGGWGGGAFEPVQVRRAQWVVLVGYLPA